MDTAIPCNRNMKRLVADVGGTNTRLAIYDPGSNALSCVQSFTNLEHTSLQAVIAHWLAELEEAAPAAACLAVAGPPGDDQVMVSNTDWSFSQRQLAEQFGFKQIRVINDFEGNAYALPHLGDEQLSPLQVGRPSTAHFAVLGPGTGLGGAILNTRTIPVAATACEPGHIGLSPGNPLELEIFKLLLPEYGNINAELLLSGPGLRRLYQTLGLINDQVVESLSPAEVSTRAMAGEDALCSQALNTFCAWLGSICGDFVLASGAYGGLYLAGGIVPRILPYLVDSDYLARFHQKGKMGEQLGGVPVYAITSGQPGLIGAAHAELVPA